jgi:hypothetical protein
MINLIKNSSNLNLEMTDNVIKKFVDLLRQFDLRSKRKDVLSKIAENIKTVNNFSNFFKIK